MFIFRPANPNGLLVIADSRSHTDRSAHRYTGEVHALHSWPFQRSLPIGEWSRTARVCLFEQGQTPTPEQRTKARRELRHLLGEAAPKACAIIGPLSASARRNKLSRDESWSVAQSVGWSLWSPPASISECGGCIVELEGLPPVIPIPNPLNLDWVFGELTRRWLRRAWELATGSLSAWKVPRANWVPGGEQKKLLRKLRASHARGQTLTVDVEAFTDGSVTTAIGLGIGDLAVSVPWDTYRPYGRADPEPGCDAETRELVRSVLACGAPKTMQNGLDYDVPHLAALGLPVGGVVRDTMLMHGVVYGQYRHGLQHAVSQEMPCSPWKSEHMRGKNAADPRVWVADPLELRRYNCSDVYYTGKLDGCLAPKVGLTGESLTSLLAQHERELARATGPRSLSSLG